MSVLNRSLAAFSVAVILLSISSSSITSAVTAADWKPGRIIDDAVFTDKNALSVAQIQAFLNSKVPTCDTWGTKTSELGGGTRAQYGASNGNPAPFTCLKDYYEVPKTSPGPGEPASNYGGAPIPPGAQSAAQIISNAAIKYNINPKVLLVKLATESPGPLTSDDWPFKRQYLYAMGAHCPDSGPGGSANCDSNYASFSLQMDEAAALLRWYLDSMNQPWWQYKKPYQVNNILWNVVERGCGGADVYIETMATAALYTYTPYQPNQAALNNMYGTGDNCSAYGNRNFWRVFSDWFGTTYLPGAFKTANSPDIYMNVGGYKVNVPQMATVQDYGISPQSIQTISQTTFDAIPSPSVESGISSHLNYIIKSTSDQDADGGSIYMVSRGKKYHVASMDQFNDYGFKVSNIAYVPLSFIYSLSGNSMLSNFVQSPTQNVFKVSAGEKRIFFNYDTYRTHNPSDIVTPVSYYIADAITSGIPIISGEALVKYSNSERVYLLKNNVYYDIASYDAYSCWGFEGANRTPVYRLTQNNYVAPIIPASVLNCIIKVDTTSYALNKNNKLTIPDTFGVQSVTLNQDLTTLANRLPTAQNALKRFIKGAGNAGIWYLENGQIKSITSNGYSIFGLDPTKFDNVEPGVIREIPANGVHLANGQLVKKNGDASVYVVFGNARILYPTSDLFLDYKNSWSNIETHSVTLLDSDYPYTIGESVTDFLYSSVASQTYLISAGNCYKFDQAMLVEYGKDQSTIQTNQPYDTSIFRNLSLASCKNSSRYLKAAGQDTVYRVKDGKRYPLTWDSFLADNGGTEPSVITVSSSFLTKIPLQ